ncbi:MAG: DUF5666 domain-containing protein, partial [Pseudomonadota bacterium]
MRRFNRRMAMSVLGSGWIAACAPVRVSDTGKSQPRGGIGGTGIVGTLTDFGSLIVNGLRIETDAMTDVSSALGPVDPAALGIGHSLTIEAESGATGYLARRVSLSQPLIGRVTDLSADRSTARINGVEVTLEPGAIGDWAQGTRIAVSGVWRADRVIASRLDWIADDLPDVIAGELQPEGLIGIAGRAVNLGGLSAPDSGSFVTALGRNRPDRFEVSELRAGRFIGAAGSLVQLSVEGYLDPISTAPFYRLSGLGHSFDPNARLGAFAEQRSLLTGPYRGTFEVATAIRMPDDFEARRKRIRDVAAGAAE